MGWIHGESDGETHGKRSAKHLVKQLKFVQCFCQEMMENDDEIIDYP